MPPKSKSDQTVKVYLRVRPLITREVNAKHTTNRITFYPNNKSEVYVEQGANQGRKTFHFHEVFPPGTPQNYVYDRFAADAVEAAFSGYHGVMFVYGQTASGKTFTISNDKPGELGMLQQSMFKVWDTIQSDKESTYNCTLSYVEIYNDEVSDLLADGNPRVKLQTASLGEVIMLSERTGEKVGVSVSSYKQTMDCFLKGQEAKATSATNMNDRSSRSHTIFSLDIEKSSNVVDPSTGAMKSLTALKGRLILCDLAGSERVSKTGAEGTTLKEAGHINSSLLVLGNVVKALTDPTVQHAPFRESKLTRILQYSLTGHGKTSIVVTISPSDDNVEESVSAIRFGQRAIMIKQSAQKHEIRDYQALYLALQQELDRRVDDGIVAAVAEEKRLAAEKLDAAESQIKLLEAENQLLKKENASLRRGAHVDPNSADVGRQRSESSANLLDRAKASDGKVDQESQALIRSLCEKLRDKMAELDKLHAERAALAEKARQEESKCYSLGIRFRDVVERTTLQRLALEREIDALRAESAAAKGVEFLSATFPSRAETEMENEALPKTPPVLSPRPGGQDQGVSTRIMDELTKAHDAIAILRQERTELLAYQLRASDAIRLLYHEKQELQQKLKK